MENGAKMVTCLGFSPCVQRVLQFSKLGVGEVNRAENVTVGIGGKGANAARMISQLGGNARHIGFVGGSNGKLFEQLMENENVSFRHIQTEGETRICQTLIESGNSQSTELVEEMPAVSDDEWAHMVELIGSLDLSGVVTISGKLPAGVPVGGYAQVVRAVNEQDGRVIIDAPGEPLMHSLSEGPFLVKINRMEMMQVTDDVSSFLECGAQSVLITDGSNPTAYLSETEMFEIRPPKIDAVNAVGSGDAVTAGIAFELANDASIDDAIKTGMACGAANALSVVSGSLNTDDVERLTGEVVFHHPLC